MSTSSTSSTAGGHDDAFAREWTLGADGLWCRSAARVVVLDTAAGTGADEVRLLLVRGHDADQVDRSWWFTTGGGLGPGEDPAAGAARELLEETGLVVSPGELVGPVFTRSAVFDFVARTCRQDELFFLALVPGAEARGVVTDGWTPLEGDVLDELRWWSLPDLAAAEAAGELVVYPHGLPGLLEPLLGGWDGVLREIGD